MNSALKTEAQAALTEKGFTLARSSDGRKMGLAADTPRPGRRPEPRQTDGQLAQAAALVPGGPG
ncbi:hypothetical protein, partial [Streptomyces sp. IBSBF 2394]|uniref:hypothetical protein n=1 Tax=Streptomyces sp. IBSBF 2394 TaxID=2903532 RepID=UPI002FDC274E